MNVFKTGDVDTFLTTCNDVVSSETGAAPGSLADGAGKFIGGVVQATGSVVNSISGAVDNYQKQKVKRQEQERLAQLMPMKNHVKNYGWSKVLFGGGAFFSVIFLINLITGLAGDMTNAIATNADYVQTCLQAGIPLAMSQGAMWYGRAIQKRDQVFQRIKKAFGKTPYAKLEDLSSKTRVPEQKLTQHLDDLINNNTLPKAYYVDDEDVEYVVLSEPALDMLDKHVEKEKIRNREKSKEEALKNQYPQVEASILKLEELSGVIARALSEDCVRKNEAFSKNLNKLRSTIKQIIVYAKDHPENIPEMKSFLSYFIPTVEKLVTTYEQLAAQPLETENIRTTKQDIESTMDSVNLAFENLYDSFFEYTAMDVGSDISVMQTLFKQKGLGESDFEENKR